AERTPYEEQIAYLVGRRVEVETGRAEGRLKKKYEKEWKAYEAVAKKKPGSLQKAWVATDVGTEAPPTYLASRTGKKVIGPGFIKILDPKKPDIQPIEELNSTGRRTALANWITDPKNPLTARVIVNRVWQFHFGRGLSVNTSEFGTLGEEPTHPELLDWLTAGFIENGWSIKWLHRQMVNTESYRQSSLVPTSEHAAQVDPGNKFMWRARPQRLDAEQMRDTLLMLSGELKDRGEGRSSGGSTPVRSVYLQKKRNSPDEVLSRFDAPAGFTSVSKRDATNTPLQSLLMVNAEWPYYRASKMASRVRSAHPNADRAELAKASFELVYGRPATKAEIEGGKNFLLKQEEVISGKEPEPRKKLDGELVSAERIFAPLAKKGEKAISFDPESAHKKLRVTLSESEGELFAVEAVVRLESFYKDASVRTLVSRWNGNHGTPGWSLGLTSDGSRYDPHQPLIQLIGYDFQGEMGTEDVLSGLKMEKGKPYYIAAVFRDDKLAGQKFGGTVDFYLKDLSDPKAELQHQRVAHGLERYHNKSRAFVLGGRDGQSMHTWDGELYRFALTKGELESSQLIVNSEATPKGRLSEVSASQLESAASANLAWSSAGTGKNEPADFAALIDLCHVLINSNEFLYLP
ncbi:MAG: DUF1553 domain-containing protein, partial [Verrucomicrobiales bacterium]